MAHHGTHRVPTVDYAELVEVKRLLKRSKGHGARRHKGLKPRKRLKPFLVAAGRQRQISVERGECVQIVLLAELLFDFSPSKTVSLGLRAWAKEVGLWERARDYFDTAVTPMPDLQPAWRAEGAGQVEKPLLAPTGESRPAAPTTPTSLRDLPLSHLSR